MPRLELILIFVLQFEACISVESLYLYNRPGQDVTLSCGRASDTTCSNIEWFYNSNRFQTLHVVQKGEVEKSSVRADRLSLGSDCSLVINNITAEDAGLYYCQQERNADQDISTFLNVLTISPSPPDADPERDGEVTLICILLRYSEIKRCQQNSIRWVDETGTVLDGEGVGYKVLGQSNCHSFLTVKRQRGNNRRYTCQFVDRGNTLVETDYTPVFNSDKRDDQPGKSNPDGSSNQTYIIIGVVVGVVVLLLVIAAVLIKHRKRAEVREGTQKPTHQQSDEPESNLTYVTVNHSNYVTSPKRTAKEEAVTYSTVRIQ